MTISQATKFLETAYSTLNKEYFEGALTRPIITIQTDPRAYGRYIPSQWADLRGNKYYDEINIGAETLDRPLVNVIATLLHEMIHQYCELNNIQETSRGGTYHNRKFKEEAEKRALSIEYDQRIGWSITQPTPVFRSFCSAQHWRNKLTIVRFGLVGGKDPAPKKPSSTRKYLCPCCGLSIRATRKVDIICADCRVHLVCDQDQPQNEGQAV